MLFSMTGYGASTAERDGVRAAVEVRAVNHRHLKLVVRGPEPYPLQEAEFEKLARTLVKRGSLLVHVSVERDAALTMAKLNAAVLKEYVNQIRAALPAEFVDGALAGLLGLPGVAPAAHTSGPPPESEWPAVAEAFQSALAELNAARRAEGAAMGRELLAIRADMAGSLAEARESVPRVMADYRARLLERVRQAVGAAGVTVEESNLIRELAIYADRTDISEEIVRLAAHLEQFGILVNDGSPEGGGRRLEFLAQEIGREVNTLASKAGDARLSRTAFDLKSALERVKELIANVE